MLKKQLIYPLITFTIFLVLYSLIIVFKTKKYTEIEDYYQKKEQTFKLKEIIDFRERYGTSPFYLVIEDKSNDYHKYPISIEDYIKYKDKIGDTITLNISKRDFDESNQYGDIILTTNVIQLLLIAVNCFILSYIIGVVDYEYQCGNLKQTNMLIIELCLYAGLLFMFSYYFYFLIKFVNLTKFF